MDTLSEDLLEVLSVICHWRTYHGTRCRRTINQDNPKGMVTLCPLHKDLIIDYEHLKSGDEFCQTYRDIKIVPRSHKHLRSVMKQLHNEDDIIEVCVKDNVGGMTEEADISDPDFIKLLSDDTCYYYTPSNKTDRNAKNLRVILRKFCPNSAVIRARGGEYCEDCYKKMKNVPKFSVVKGTLT